jgi:hypothetical protein
VATDGDLKVAATSGNGGCDEMKRTAPCGDNPVLALYSQMMLIQATDTTAMDERPAHRPTALSELYGPGDRKLAIVSHTATTDRKARPARPGTAAVAARTVTVSTLEPSNRFTLDDRQKEITNPLELLGPEPSRTSPTPAGS